MSTQKPGDNIHGKSRKNRSSVAVGMSTPKVKEELNMPSQLFHIQDHPLIAKSINASGISKELIRRNNRNHTTSTSSNKNFKSTSSPVKGMPISMGSLIPHAVMEDLLFRFLYNIPEIEKSNKIRVSFQVELAHWFYVDFYCSADDVQCKKLGFREFTRQVFDKCDYLKKWKSDVEIIIDEFRFYKSNVPTYGIILLDSTLNYVLLVQGYFASKNSWGFPKGKVNEDEIPIQCAIREVLEETGFDAIDKIVTNKRPLQVFSNDTFIRLYIATDVPMDFKFEPHLRKEIRKISWFSIWELPKDRNDTKSCKKLGLSPNNFYTVLPFVNDIQNFVKREQAKRQKPKVTILRKDSSAFHPVIPRTGFFSSTNSPSISNSPTNSVQFEKNLTDISAQDPCILESIFSPIQNTLPMSFTGEGFLETFLAATSDSASSSCLKLPSTSGIQSTKEIKQPKPVHSNLVINVYEAPSSEINSLSTSPVKLLSSNKVTTLLSESSIITKKDPDELSKAFNTIFEKLQASAFDSYMSSTSAVQLTAVSVDKRKDVGAVGELATESQRSKLKQHHQQKKKQQKQSLKNLNDQNNTEYQKAAEFHNQGISVDLTKLFGPSMSSCDILDSPGTLLDADNESILKEKDCSPICNAANELMAKLGVSTSLVVADYVLSTPVFASPNTSGNSLMSSSRLNAEFNSYKYNVFSPNIIFTAESIAEEFIRQSSRPKIELCNAWKNFKLDRLKVVPI